MKSLGTRSTLLRHLPGDAAQRYVLAERRWVALHIAGSWARSCAGARSPDDADVAEVAARAVDHGAHQDRDADVVGGVLDQGRSRRISEWVDVRGVLGPQHEVGLGDLAGADLLRERRRGLDMVLQHSLALAVEVQAGLGDVALHDRHDRGAVRSRRGWARADRRTPGPERLPRSPSVPRRRLRRCELDTASVRAAHHRGGEQRCRQRADKPDERGSPEGGQRCQSALRRREREAAPRGSPPNGMRDRAASTPVQSAARNSGASGSRQNSAASAAVHRHERGLEQPPAGTTAGNRRRHRSRTATGGRTRGRAPGRAAHRGASPARGRSAPVRPAPRRPAARWRGVGTRTQRAARTARPRSAWEAMDRMVPRAAACRLGRESPAGRPRRTGAHRRIAHARASLRFAVQSDCDRTTEAWPGWCRRTRDA